MIAQGLEAGTTILCDNVGCIACGKCIQYQQAARMAWYYDSNNCPSTRNVASENNLAEGVGCWKGSLALPLSISCSAPLGFCSIFNGSKLRLRQISIRLLTSRVRFLFIPKMRTFIQSSRDFPALTSWPTDCCYSTSPFEVPSLFTNEVSYDDSSFCQGVLTLVCPTYNVLAYENNLAEGENVSF